MNTKRLSLLASVLSMDPPIQHDLLRTERGFSPLGVACHLYNPNLWKLEPILGCYSYLGETTLLPERVMRYYGFDSNEGLVIPKEVISSVVRPVSKDLSLRELGNRYLYNKSVGLVLTTYLSSTSP